MNEEMRESLIDNMINNLPTLRKKLDVNQEKLAVMAGVSRSTIAFIENKKRPMTWNMFLSLVLIFSENSETEKLLAPLGIYTEAFNDVIKMRTDTVNQ